MEQLLDLLEDSSSLSELAVVLKANGIPISGTWDFLRTQRILPAIANGALPISDLLRLLQDTEEYGNQHIFLYNTKPSVALGLVNENSLKNKLTSLGRNDLLSEPDLLNIAGSRALADARLERGAGGRALVLKSVESRVFYKLEDQHDEKGGRYRIKRYKRHETRAVDVLRVHSDGFSELRIHAHDSSADYSEQVTAAWNFFGHFLSRFQFEDASISKAQQYLWKNRENLRSVLRYSDSRLRDAKGTVLSAATGTQQDSLFDNEKASKSLDAFWDDETVCDKSNVWWLKMSEEADAVPSRAIHMVMSGSPNEFTLPGRCSRGDYEYVLAQIRKANK